MYEPGGNRGKPNRPLSRGKRVVVFSDLHLGGGGRRDDFLPNGELLAPCLFNSGCCIGKRGLTWLEIAEDGIALVHRFDRNRSRHSGEALAGTPSAGRYWSRSRWTIFSAACACFPEACRRLLP